MKLLFDRCWLRAFFPVIFFVCAESTFVVEVGAAEVQRGAMESYGAALADFKAGNLRAALSRLEQVVRVDPGNKSAHYYRAICYHRLNDLDMATRCYEYITANFPSTPESANAAKALEGLKNKDSGSSNGSTAKRATSVEKDVAPEADDAGETVAAGTVKQWPSKARIPFVNLDPNHYTVRAQLNGRGPFDMEFDTGADTTFIGLNQLSMRGVNSIKNTGKPAGYTGGAGGGERSPFWIVPMDLKLGDYMFKDVPVCVVKNNPTSALIGENVLKYYACQVDPGIHMILMTRKDSYQASHEQKIGTVSVPFRRENNQMIVDLTINGKSFPFYFDTGAYGLAISRVAVKRMGLSLGEIVDKGEISGVSGKSHASFYKIRSASLGPIKKVDADLSVDEDSKSDFALLGQEFWRDSGWQYTIDNTRSCIDFYRR